MLANQTLTVVSVKTWKEPEGNFAKSQSGYVFIDDVNSTITSQKWPWACAVRGVPHCLTEHVTIMSAREARLLSRKYIQIFCGLHVNQCRKFFTKNLAVADERRFSWKCVFSFLFWCYPFCWCSNFMQHRWTAQQAARVKQRRDTRSTAFTTWVWVLCKGRKFSNG